MIVEGEEIGKERTREGRKDNRWEGTGEGGNRRKKRTQEDSRDNRSHERRE